MKLILNRDNTTQFLETRGSFCPKIYTKSSVFKNEYYQLISIENGVANYNFIYEKPHDENVIYIKQNYESN